MKKQFLLFGFLLTLVVSFAGCQRPGQASIPGQFAKNTPAPPFSLKDLSGNTVTLEQYKGKVVLLDFWATWCPPCKREIPHLVDLSKRFQEKGVVVLGIALDDEGVKAVKPFAQEYKISYPVLIGTPEVQRAYGGIQGIPTKFIIDKEGRIVDSLVGYQDIDVIEKKIESLL